MNTYPTGTSPVMKISELQEILQIGRTTAHEMCRGPLAHLVVRVGEGRTGIRIKRAEFWTWFEGQNSPAKGR